MCLIHTDLRIKKPNCALYHTEKEIEPVSPIYQPNILTSMTHTFLEWKSSGCNLQMVFATHFDLCANIWKIWVLFQCRAKPKFEILKVAIKWNGHPLVSSSLSNSSLLHHTTLIHPQSTIHPASWTRQSSGGKIFCDYVIQNCSINVFAQWGQIRVAQGILAWLLLIFLNPPFSTHMTSYFKDPVLTSVPSLISLTPCFPPKALSNDRTLFLFIFASRTLFPHSLPLFLYFLSIYLFTLLPLSYCCLNKQFTA